jgi:S1-C subfamily serine protease
MVRFPVLWMFLLFSYRLISQDLSDLYENVKSSVVILNTKEAIIDPEDHTRKMSAEGLGSGVLIDDGRVLTAAHVVQTAEQIIVQFYDGEEITAHTIASSWQADVALLQLNRTPQNSVPARIGDSDIVKIGEQIFIVGAPYGLAHTFTVGYISGRIAPNEIGNGFAGMEFFQTDAAINEGNSGGPMFNMKGEVIGIVSHIISKSGGFEGLGFAATSNVSARILFEEGSMWTGTESYWLAEPITTLLNIPQSECLLVQRVVKGSPGDQMGLKPGYYPIEIEGESFLLGGDIILEVDGIAINGAASLERIRQQLNQRKPGEQFHMILWRKGERIKLNILK